jgi:hypothetical protein
MITELYGGTRETGPVFGRAEAYSNWGWESETPFEVRYSTEINLSTDVPGQNPIGRDPNTVIGYRTMHPENILGPQRLTALRLRTGVYVRRIIGGTPVISIFQQLNGGTYPDTYQVFIDDVAVSPVRTVVPEEWFPGNLDFTLPTVTRLNPYRQMKVEVLCTFGVRPVGPDELRDRFIAFFGGTLEGPQLFANYEMRETFYNIRTTVAEVPGVNANRIFANGTSEFWANSQWRIPGTIGRPVQSPWLSNPSWTTPTFGLWNGGNAVFDRFFQLNLTSQLIPATPGQTRTATLFGNKQTYSPWGIL